MGKLVWLASYPKSGNTWVRAFLHNYIAQPEQPYSINQLIDFTVAEPNVLFFEPHDPRPPAAWSLAEVQAMRPKVHRDLTRLHPDLVFVKTHNACLAVHDVPLCTPEVTEAAIYILRDPRDVAVSYSAYTGRGLDEIIGFMNAPQAANRATETQVFELLGSWSLHVGSWTRQQHGRMLVLRYEDLLERPAETFGRLIAFLGGAPDPARLARAVAFSSFETLARQEALQGYAAHASDAAAPFFRAGIAGQWRTALSPAQRARIEAEHQAIMRRFGYLPGPG
jgi:hypothetical protein